jgi:hypothetical protein
MPRAAKETPPQQSIAKQESINYTIITRLVLQAVDERNFTTLKNISDLFDDEEWCAVLAAVDEDLARQTNS